MTGPHRLAAGLALVASNIPLIHAVNMTDVTVQAPTNIEVDVIFPRNDTYERADSFPIVFAIQNNAAAQRFGGFIFTWILRPYSGTYGTNGNFWVDFSQYSSFGDEPQVDDPLLIINRTLSLAKTSSTYDRQYELQWAFSFIPRCEADSAGMITENATLPMLKEFMVFTVQDGAKKPDIMQAPECPQLGSLISVKQNVSTSGEPFCPVLGDTGKKADPCAVKVDKTLAGNIASVLNALPIPTPTSSPDSGSGHKNSAVRSLVHDQRLVGVFGLLGVFFLL